MKMKAMLSSILTIALCLSLIAGSTFALFTSTDKVNVAVNSGKVNVAAWYVDGSLTHTSTLGSTLPETTVTTDGTTLTIDKMVPGDVVTIQLHVENGSNVTAKYRTILECVEDTGLLEGLEITVDGADYVGFACSKWTELAGNAAINDVIITVSLPEDRGNEYQGKTARFAYIVEAVQGNAKVSDFDGVNVRDINDLRLLAAQVAMGDNYDGKTVVLNGDMDLQGKPMLPIGTKSNPFRGNFDGQGYTVKNFTVVKSEGAGLFGYVGKAGVSTTISNVKVDNFTILSNHYAGGIVGKMNGNVIRCTATNGTITVTPSGENGNYDNGDKAGGIVGWNGYGHVQNNTVKNVTVTAYRDLGGIVGCVVDDMNSFDPQITGNSVENVSLLYDATGKICAEDPQGNAGAIVGRVSGGSAVVENNTVNGTVAPTVLTPATAQAAIDNANAEAIFYLAAGEYDTLIMKSNVTIIGLPGAVVGFVNLNGASNVALKNLEFDAAKAGISYDGKGNGKQNANIAGSQTKGGIGARNILIEGCTFTGHYANGGVAIAFTDQGRGSGQSGNITVKGCTFETTGTYYNVYTHYSGWGYFNIEDCTFGGEVHPNGYAIYLGRYQSNTPVVVKGNTFENYAAFENAAYIQAHSAAYTVSFDASNNTFGN